MGTSSEKEHAGDFGYMVKSVGLYLSDLREGENKYWGKQGGEWHATKRQRQRRAKRTKPWRHTNTELDQLKNTKLKQNKKSNYVDAMITSILQNKFLDLIAAQLTNHLARAIKKNFFELITLKFAALISWWGLGAPGYSRLLSGRNSHGVISQQMAIIFFS